MKKYLFFIMTIAFSISAYAADDNHTFENGCTRMCYGGTWMSTGENSWICSHGTVGDLICNGQVVVLAGANGPSDCTASNPCGSTGKAVKSLSVSPNRNPIRSNIKRIKAVPVGR